MTDRTHELREKAFLNLIESLEKENAKLLEELKSEMSRGDALSTALNNSLISYPQNTPNEIDKKKGYQRTLDTYRWSEYKYRRNQ